MTTRQEWNYLPETPIQVSPLWQWPPKPYAVFRWYFDSWFFITVNLTIVAIAFIVYFFASPTLTQTSAFQLWWIALIWVRNAIIVTLLAGTLHLWFHKYAIQDTNLKYDPRPFPRNGRMFTL